MKTYLFFGSFNPFHSGHLALALHILEYTSSDLWFIVSPQNPHKDPAILAPFNDRYSMVKAVAENLGKRVMVSDIENKLPIPSYTFNTISRLKETYPKRSFTIIAGSDIATTIHTWYKYEDLIKLADLEIYPRKENERYLSSPNFQNAPVMEFSSTDFRTNKNLTWIPKEVSEYIISNHLYGF